MLTIVVASAPVGPVGPMSPIPVGPCAPVAPGWPVGPVTVLAAPIGPVGPVAPAPVGPTICAVVWKVPSGNRTPPIVVAVLASQMFPATCSLPSGVEVPIPTLPKNSASLIVPSSSTSMLGTPLMSFTAKMVPVMESVMLNSWPVDPEKLRVLLLSMVATMLDVVVFTLSTNRMFCVVKPFLTTNLLLIAKVPLSPCWRIMRYLAVIQNGDDLAEGLMMNQF